MTHGRFLAAAAALGLAAGCGGEGPAESGSAPEAAPAALSGPAIAAADLARHIRTLASDEFEGRAPATPGGEKTRAYIAGEFERLGFEPVGDSYFQPVPLVESTLDPARSWLRIETPEGEKELAYREDAVFWTKRVAENVDLDASEMVFVGYGVVAPEYGWNDYEGLDVAGKTVVMLVNDPGFATGDPELFNGRAMTYYGRWTYKYEEAARQGAAAALVIHEDDAAGYGWGVVEGSWSGPQLDLARADDGASRVAVEGWLSNAAARDLFAAAGLDFDALKAAAKTREFKAQPLTGLTASAKLANAIRRSESANVVGVLPGAEAPDEYVLYMGHWDHLGVNPDTEGEDKIYNGAVDNATGIAAILEIGEKFATNPERPRRSILLAAVTAEESGLLGSAYLAENPPVPLKNIVGGINIDAVLPLPATRDIIVIGHGASELEDILAERAQARDMYVRPDAEPEKGYFYRSDHISLAKKGVPMLYADAGIDLVEGGEKAGLARGAQYTAERYHKPADEFDESWTFDGMIRTVEVLYETGAALAYSDRWPNWYEGNEFRVLRDAQRADE
ncbi:M28 family metallopeptidase [Amphiplicatus metriothermophilus]|uniref:Zn-dependent amino- or carboxypeptidase, M28 family n=1 Tax=Amphiplicatus metriothermophilus TaxID=1519374 RepID=A0A239PJE1_9PROT|nr:M28 family metallopeptidase [Amphiplicatus metriothermophilus]MBB5517745.1 Zn-dependent M28 family amino/carboxypeptidase [Amphiplicatus metriothermophilus]SNT67921.1 Zn-dependent amino- or carboxypeptidase, M28 family [Amphiplicatus metriothermophilus]